MGGTGTAVSIHSAHRQEAIALVRFQLRALMQAGEKGGPGAGPAQTEFSDLPFIAEPDASPPASNLLTAIIARPSVATGSKYKPASKAYIDAVHSVLTGEKEGPAAAAELEKQLIEITGFRAGPPADR